jgi:hypothetical protein
MPFLVSKFVGSQPPAIRILDPILPINTPPAALPSISCLQNRSYSEAGKLTANFGKNIFTALATRHHLYILHKIQ